jgi:hypothetical protein
MANIPLSLEQLDLRVELKLPKPVELQEKYFEVLPEYSKEQIIEKAVNKKTDLFARFGGLSKPKPEEIKMRGVKKFLKPYWYLKGCYECRWENETSYPIPVPEDVLAIKFEDKTIKVKKEALAISDMLDKIGININLGLVSVPSTPLLSSALKAIGRDKVIGGKRHIALENIIEFRLTRREAELCLDASTGKEDKETLKLITKDAKEIEKREIPKISKGYALEKLKEKFKEIDKYIENEAEKIDTRKLFIREIKLVLIPWYEATFEMDQRKKSWRICAVNGKMEKG